MPQNVILISDVPGLGQVGDQCRVKEGYLRNYLLPHNLALRATPDALKRFELQKTKLMAAREKQLKFSQTLAEKLGKVGLVFERPVGPNGRLFGSVTPMDIVTELAKQGASVEKRSVLMNGPLKAAGDHNIRVRVHSQVVVDLPVKVVGIEVKKGSGSEDFEDAGEGAAPEKEEAASTEATPS